LNAATAPRAVRHAARLLHVDPARDTVAHGRALDLPRRLRPGDLVIVNDAATLPGSLRLPELDAEVRLVAHGARPGEFTALLFGPGDHRTPTERRPPPPGVELGQRLCFGGGLEAVVTAVDAQAPRLIQLGFSRSGAELLQALYRLGRPVQYAHVPEALEVWDVQNRYGGRPWAFELPSAGYALDGELLLALRQRGVAIATLTHAAGISSTGSVALDRRFPLPERFEIPAATVAAIAAARAHGGRVLAVGTTVVRALEASAADHGTPRAGRSEARLRLGHGFEPRVVHGVLSGVHEPDTPHFALLQAFAPRALLERALGAARVEGYLLHEFGDTCLVWSSAPKPGARDHGEPEGAASSQTARAAA